VIALVLAFAALAIVIDPRWAPLVVVAANISAALPWLEAWRMAGGTALRPALVWVALAMGLLLAAQVCALLEPLEGGRPGAGHFTYLAVLSLLAALTSVLNARSPGGRVWAGLMVLLVVVFLIPWLEEPGRMRRAHGLTRLHLDAPWSLFYAILVVMGVTNYLPTQFGAAALGMGILFVLEYLSLTRVDWSAASRATIGLWVSWLMALNLWLARWSKKREAVDRSGCERLWFWFRDHWGVVWALRVSERFNRTAGLAGWPVRLTWFGLEPATTLPAGETPAVPDEALATLRGLLRRFARPERLDQAAADGH
jgi:hypothetical protein